MDISKDWEKIVLVLVALITLVLAGLTIKNSLAYGGKFELRPVTPSDVLPEMEKETVVTSKNMVEKKTIWNLLEIAPKGGTKTRPIPLFKSITIVEIQGELIDMSDLSAKKIRPPVENKWLLDNELDFLSADVLTQDPDGDQFSNLEEWNAKTSPSAADEHPPYVGKLKGIARRQKDYILEFAAQPDEERYQIIRHPSSGYKRDTFILRKGEISEDKMFRIDGYEKKEAISKLGIKVDASELSITYLPDERNVKLVRRVIQAIPTYFGQFIMTIGPAPEEFFVKKGDTFRLLPLDPETDYKLIDIDTEKAVISFESEPGEVKTINIKLGK